ncbi:MAG: DUF2203 domain-containing protein [bacterium]
MKYFSLQQAIRILPEVEPVLLSLRDLQTRALQTKERVDLLWQRLEAGERVLDEIASVQSRLDADVAEMRSLVERLETLGVILRDVGMGLIDFPAIVVETEFYLCWRLGEDSIQFWHGVDEGIGGRKPLWTMPGGRPNYA